MKKLGYVLFFLFCFSVVYAQQVSDNIRSLLSTEGKVLYGNEPNSIVVIDYPDNVQRVEDYLAMVDTVPQQVLIEARVIEAKLQKEHSLGVNWRLFADKGYLPIGTLKSGSASTLGALPGPITQSLSYKNTLYPPVSSSGVSETPFTFAIFDDNINVVLQTLANAVDTSILSAPRITTVNNREAELKIIQSVPWAEPQATTTDGVTTVTWVVHFEQVGISLKVTPTINEAGNIAMELYPQISEKTGELPLTASGVSYNVPIIDRREATTKVIVGNGQTLIIGGLIKDKVIKGETKIPFLGDIPGFGYLFKSKKDTFDKTELMIFVSPTIITPNEFVKMGQQERYGLGKHYFQEKQKQEKDVLVAEAQEKKKQKETATKVEMLNKKHSSLLSEREALEQDLRRQEQDLRVLEEVEKVVVEKMKQ
ncbi:MAG: hypothetical protein WDL87_07110 [Candidatus Omnitrophota bacterium]|jgi:type II secretory pathway component GspD/PulD (secretin)